MSILLRPMRREAPAARITPAAVKRLDVVGMDRDRALAHRARPPAGANREQLGDDAERHLLRAVGPDIQAYRPVDSVPLRLVKLALCREVDEDPLGALPRAEHAD